MDAEQALVTSGCVTLWIGESLGPVERACMRSVLGQGHGLALYCYRPPSGVPQGVELRDAAAVVPEERVMRHRTGSVAPFADWFRYELQRLGLGTWVDTDLYLLAPLDTDRPYLFGEESHGWINNGVLRLPADSPLLAALLEIFQKPTTPWWLPWRPYLAGRIRELLNGEADLSKMPWGTTGPRALTALAGRFGLADQAFPADVFNPVAWDRADWILDPAMQLADVISERTVAVHLWNECIKTFKNAPAPQGSFLERLHREGAR